MCVSKHNKHCIERRNLDFLLIFLAAYDVNPDFFRNFLTETSGFCEWQRASNDIFYTPSVARMIPFSVHSTGATAELSFLFRCSQPIQNRCFLQSKDKAKIVLTQTREEVPFFSAGATAELVFPFQRSQHICCLPQLALHRGGSFVRAGTHTHFLRFFFPFLLSPVLFMFTRSSRQAMP